MRTGRAGCRRVHRRPRTPRRGDPAHRRDLVGTCDKKAKLCSIPLEDKQAVLLPLREFMLARVQLPLHGGAYRYHLGRGTPAARHEARQITPASPCHTRVGGSGPSGQRRGVALSTLRTQTVLLVVSERRRNSASFGAGIADSSPRRSSPQTRCPGNREQVSMLVAPSAPTHRCGHPR